MKLWGRFNICTIKVEIKAYSLFQDIYEEHLGDFLFLKKTQKTNIKQRTSIISVKEMSLK